MTTTPEEIAQIKADATVANNLAQALVAGQVTAPEQKTLETAACNLYTDVYDLVPDVDPPPPSGLPVPAGYSLLWSDQFTGTTLNPRWGTGYATGGQIWNNRGTLPAGYTGNNSGTGQTGAAVMHASQLSVNNGLTITATKNSTGVQAANYPWISGIINSMGNNVLPTTGWCVRVNAKMADMSLGGWGAVWFLPALNDPSQDELDGFEGGFNELSGVPVNSVCHYDYFDSAGQQHADEFNIGVDMSAGFHIYEVRWTPGGAGKIEYLFDNVLKNTIANTNVTAQGYEIMVNLQIATQSCKGWHSVPVVGSFPTTTMQVAEVQVCVP